VVRRRGFALSYKVIQWGVGLNGQALVRAIARHRDLELVGARVWSETKNGADAGVLAGIAALGVAATTDRRALVDLDADVVICCPQARPDMTENDQDIVDLLRSGKNVISVSGAHSMPAALAGYAEQFEAACRDGGSTFAAAGLNPSFIGERLATTVTGLCADVESLTAEETYLCAEDNQALVFDTVGFGRRLKQWGGKESPIAVMFDRMYSQSVHNMAHTLGVELAEVVHTVDLVAADRDIALPAGLIQQGTVAMVSQAWQGVPRDPDQIRITVRVQWAVADDIAGHPISSGWQVHVSGKPNLRLQMRVDPPEDRTDHHETMVGSAIAVIPEVMNAEPGILLPKIFAPFKRRFVQAPGHVAASPAVSEGKS
jgi:2,4-diaminopentanoate dehydrogenase